MSSHVGQEAHNPYVVQQNFPDGTSPIVHPGYAATAEGQVNPACGQAKAAAAPR